MRIDRNLAVYEICVFGNLDQLISIVFGLSLTLLLVVHINRKKAKHRTPQLHCYSTCMK